jgi:hypothetical protein
VSLSAILDDPDEAKQRLGLPASGVLELSHLEADPFVCSNLSLDRSSLIVDRFHQLRDGNSIEAGKPAEPSGGDRVLTAFVGTEHAGPNRPFRGDLDGLQRQPPGFTGLAQSDTQGYFCYRFFLAWHLLLLYVESW